MKGPIHRQVKDTYRIVGVCPRPWGRYGEMRTCGGGWRGKTWEGMDQKGRGRKWVVGKGPRAKEASTKRTNSVSTLLDFKSQ